MFAAMVVTWSVGSTGSAVVALCVWAAVAAAIPATRALLRWRRLLTLLVCGACLVAFYLLPHPLNPHQPSLLREAFGSQRWEDGWPTRVAIWKTTWHMIDGAPLAGVGAGNFTLEFVRQVPPSVVSDKALAMYAGSYTNDAHNEYLHVWSEGGIVALLLLGGAVAAFYACVRGGLRRLGEPSARLAVLAAGAGATTFLLDALMTFPMRLPAHIGAFVFFLAVPVVLCGRAAGNGRRGRLTAKFAAALLLVATVAALVWQVRRVVAEHALKQGRSVIESALIARDGPPMSTWQAAESAFASGSRALAGGDRARADQLFALARLTLDSPETSATLNLFERAVKTDPGYSNASSRLGALLLMAGDYARARDVLRADPAQPRGFRDPRAPRVCLPLPG